MKIIGISGKLGTGKSLLAEKLRPYGFVRVSLAAPLKQMCMELYGFTTDQVWGEGKDKPSSYFRHKEHSGKIVFYTPRDILIREGWLKRCIDKDFWCKWLLKSLNPDQDFVIDDIRFQNELDFFKKLGAKFVRLERDTKLIGKEPLSDISECDLDQYVEWDGFLTAQYNKCPHDLEQFAEYLVNHL